MSTIAKSGTYFIAAVLNALGFERSPIHCKSDTYGDWRCQFVAKERLDHTYKYNVSMPFCQAIALVSPGQYLLAHLTKNEQIEYLRFQNINNVLFVIRDLRYVCVSYMRHLQNLHALYERASGLDIATPYCSTEQVRAFLSPGDQLFQFHVNSLIAEVKLAISYTHDPISCFVRYEEMVSHDREKMSPSLASLARVCGCSEDDIFEAVEQSEGQITPTFNKNHSLLQGVWDKEIEELFKKLGLDVLNEQLGYPRDYSPERYI